MIFLLGETGLNYMNMKQETKDLIGVIAFLTITIAFIIFMYVNEYYTPTSNTLQEIIK